MLRRFSLYFFALGLLMITAVYANEPSFATAAEAEKMVKKAVSHVKSAGPTVAYADFTNKKSEYVDRDLYVTVYDFKGNVLAHGQVEKMVGKNLIDLTDVAGKQFIRERVELGRAKPSFWQEYKFVDPVTKQVLPKQMYCERLNETLVCGGVYKR
jgi:signal transduction histidine kinase